METRSSATTTCWLIGETLDVLTGNKLPSNGQILRRFFHHSRFERKSVKDSAVLTSQELGLFWEKARIPTKRVDHVIEKIKRLHEKYNAIQKHSTRDNPKDIEERQNFLDTLDDLFDIAHSNAEKLITIQEDKDFLKLQRMKGRKGYMTGVDKKLTAIEKRRTERESVSRNRLEREHKRNEVCTVELESSSSESRTPSPQKKFDPDYAAKEPRPSTSRHIGTVDIVSSSLASALDRTGISNRSAAQLLAATVDALGLPVDDFKLSAESIRRRRRESRKIRAEEIRRVFSADDVLTVHWDSKLLPALTGTEKVDRLAICISGGGRTKLLEVPVIPKATGEAQAEAVKNSLQDWELIDDVEFMSFDTTSVNTGEHNGACALLQRKLSRSLINLACRHHILELVATAAFETQFGDSKSPDVAIFKRFRDNWTRIDKTTFDAGTSDENIGRDVADVKDGLIQNMVNKLQKTEEFEKRGDYRELLELGIIFLGGTPPRGIRFQQPGAFHHARWMAKLIYCLKIFLFRAQFPMSNMELTGLSNFLVFVVRIYIDAWFRCKNAVAAPRRDLILLRNLMEYEGFNAEISKATLNKFLRHLWYLNEVLIGLSFFDPMVSFEEKRAMLAALHQNGALEIRPRAHLNTEGLGDTCLHHFVSENTLLLFDALRVDKSFLEADPTSWNGNPAYEMGRMKASKLEVVNDLAERGIALIKTFTPIITRHEEQMQYLLQVSEEHRKELPIPTKKELSKYYSHQ